MIGSPTAIDNNCYLSIVIPVFNVEKYILPCLESVFRQGLDDYLFEVIIVDDGTEDFSIEVIEDIISHHSNIIVIHQDNQGLSVARNNGAAIAKGTYILFLDSDDLLIDGSLSVMLEKAIASKADFVRADYIEMGDEEIYQKKEVCQFAFCTQEKVGEIAFLEDLNPRQCYVWRTLYRKEFLEDNHLSFISNICFEDVLFTHMCYLKAKKCLICSWLLYIYRRGNNSITNSIDEKKLKDLCFVIVKLWQLKSLAGLSQEILRKLNDSVFATFSLLIYYMLHCDISESVRNEILALLGRDVPDMKFSNGLKQKVTSFLFRISPRFYFKIRILLTYIKI